MPMHIGRCTGIVIFCFLPDFKRLFKSRYLISLNSCFSHRSYGFKIFSKSLNMKAEILSSQSQNKESIQTVFFKFSCFTDRYKNLGKVESKLIQFCQHLLRT